MGLAGVALTQDFEGRVVLKDDWHNKGNSPGTKQAISAGQGETSCAEMMESGRKIDGESLKGEMSFPFQISYTKTKKLELIP